MLVALVTAPRRGAVGTIGPNCPFVHPAHEIAAHSRRIEANPPYQLAQLAALRRTIDSVR